MTIDNHIFSHDILLQFDDDSLSRPQKHFVQPNARSLPEFFVLQVFGGENDLADRRHAQTRLDEIDDRRICTHVDRDEVTAIKMDERNEKVSRKSEPPRSKVLLLWSSPWFILGAEVLVPGKNVCLK